MEYSKWERKKFGWQELNIPNLKCSKLYWLINNGIPKVWEREGERERERDCEE